MARVAVWAAVPLAAALLAGCGSSGTAVETSTPSPTPTPASVVWAGDVCVAFGGVTTSVAALGHNLTIQTSTDRTVLQQIDRQLRIQVLAIADSTDKLLKSLRAVPVDFTAANDMVVNISGHATSTKSAIGEVTGHLDAAGSAGNIVGAAGEVAQAIAAGKTAFDEGQALVAAISDETSRMKGDLKEAFDAAPQCAPFTGASTTPTPSTS